MALFWEFCRFELKFRFKSLSTYVYFVMYFLISFMAIAAEDCHPPEPSIDEVVTAQPTAATAPIPTAQPVETANLALPAAPKRAPSRPAEAANALSMEAAGNKASSLCCTLATVHVQIRRTFNESLHKGKCRGEACRTL